MQASDYITGDRFGLTQTEDGWWLTTPAPAELSRYYPALYYGGRGRRFPAFVEWVQRLLYRHRARWVTRAVGRTGRVLDVGCGPGHLLAQFRALGWDVLGTEASEDAAAIPRTRYGFDVRATGLDELASHEGAFDAVVSWHTLEHMRDPGHALDGMVRLLKPGGVLFLSVPDFNSPEAQANPPAWFHLDVPRHLCHFSRATLLAQFEKRGLVIERESHSAPEYDVFSLMQTWENRMRLPHNLLYLMLKSAKAGTAASATLVQRAIALIVAVALFPFALLLTTWRAWRKTGAVIVLLARKSRPAELRSA